MAVGTTTAGAAYGVAHVVAQGAATSQWCLCLLKNPHDDVPAASWSWAAGWSWVTGRSHDTGQNVARATGGVARATGDVTSAARSVSGAAGATVSVPMSKNTTVATGAAATAATSVYNGAGTASAAVALVPEARCVPGPSHRRH